MASVCPIKVPQQWANRSRKGYLARWLKPDGGSCQGRGAALRSRPDKASKRGARAFLPGCAKIGVADEGENGARSVRPSATIDPSGTPATAPQPPPPRGRTGAKGGKAAASVPAAAALGGRSRTVASIARLRRLSAASSPSTGSTSPASPPLARAAASPRETSSHISKHLARRPSRPSRVLPPRRALPLRDRQPARSRRDLEKPANA